MHPAIPATVLWAYAVFALVLLVGAATLVRRGDWRRAPALEKAVLLGPLFFAAPVAAFGTEHFTLAPTIAALVPRWMPHPRFWAYFVGACFIAAGFSLATRIYARLAAALLALTFFLFVVLMDLPAWLHYPFNRFGFIFVLRELAFSGGALALAAALSRDWRPRASRVAAEVARWFVGVPVVVYALEQFLHGDHVPGVPLEPLTPPWLFGHALWTYLAALGYAIAGVQLLAGVRRRAAALAAGLTALFTVLVVYVPIAWVERASLDNGFNYLADTLMFCGAILLVAGAVRNRTPAPAKANRSGA